MESIRRWWIIGLVVALGAIPPAARASRILVPGINFSGEDTKVNVPMSLIVDVALEPGGYTGPLPRDIMRKHQQDRNGKYDDRILPRLDDKDLAAIRDYALWLKERPENQVGSASQSSGQALFVPEGVSLVLRPNLAQYRGIEAVYGTLGGGPPYMPGVFIPGEGWSIPFSAGDIRPGTRAVMVIAIDHSNQKKARIMWFDIWHRDGEGRQYGPYEIHVTQAVDQHHRPFRVQGMDPVDVALSYCKGLSPAVTLVSGDAAANSVVPVPPAGAPLARVETRTGLEQTAALLPPEQDVTVRLWDERGDPLQQEVPVEIYSLDERQRATELSLPVLGPTTAHVRRGSAYGVALAQPGFALDPAPGDRTVTLHGTPVVVRRGSASGPTQFDFHRRPAPPARQLAARPLDARREPRSQVLGMRQQTPPRPSMIATRPALPGTPALGSSSGKASGEWRSAPRLSGHEMVVRVSPQSLGERELPIVWTEGGKTVRRSVLKPGATTVVERFPAQAQVVPKAGSRRWKIDRQRGSDWQTQFVALPQRGG